jgi:hypothetical protein
VPPHDFADVSPLLDAGIEQQARRVAEASVATVRELVFPRHGLR